MENKSVLPIPTFVCGPHMVKRPGIKPRLNPIDPSELDPRPPPPCVKNPCCACRPCGFPLPPPCFGMKLKQLENCYNCQVSKGCKRRQDRFYDRWQTYLDNFHKRFPNYDYTTYCCDDYVDLSVNRDFDKYLYSDFKKEPIGQRRRAYMNFLRPGFLGQCLGVQENDRSRCETTQDCPGKCSHLCNWTDTRQELVNRIRLYGEEGYSRWHEKQLAPFGFTETATLVKTRLHPFKKDTSFSAPLEETVTGRDPPFKQIRDLKALGMSTHSIGMKKPCKGF